MPAAVGRPAPEHNLLARRDRGPALRPEQEEDYGVPEVTPETATLYEHCVRAIDNGMRYGQHGLPLMGTGDWNDGMNKVGAEGKGESVWNGWFYVAVLKAFAELAGRRGDAARAAWCRERAEALRAAVEANAWDGAWYRRAYFDDGTPLGSAQNHECQIDALPQAWAVISGGTSVSPSSTLVTNSTGLAVRGPSRVNASGTSAGGGTVRAGRPA